jgi:hypothetical protein
VRCDSVAPVTEKAPTLDFAPAVAEAYKAEGAVIDLGRGIHDGKLEQGAVVQVPLRMMNRHGLVAGATGTGKTKTLQVMAEQLSAQGVPVFVADFGHQMLAKVLESNETQEPSLGLVFHYADQKGLPLLDLSDQPPEPKAEHKEAGKASGDGGSAVSDFLKSRQAKALQRQVIRGVFGMLRKRL